MLILREEYKWLKLRSELTTTKVSYECDDFCWGSIWHYGTTVGARATHSGTKHEISGARACL